MPNGYMTIQDHPFQVLGITARSTKRDVLERSDLAASADPDRITASRLQVTHPTRRIDAEVSWFPGLSPARIRHLLGDLQSDCNLSLAVEEKLGGLDPLAKINALAYWLVEHRATSGPTWALCLHHLSTNAKILDAASELDVINADRTSAGFPAFNDYTAFQKAITAHFDCVARSLAERLVNDTEHHAKVLALIVERETQEGGDLAGEFVERFVDHYQVGVQPELEAQRRGIDQACEQLLSAASAPGQRRAAAVETAIAQLERRLSDWVGLSRPIQLIMKSRGLKDSSSIEAAKAVRSAAIRLANGSGMHREAQRITAVISEAFRDVPEIAELVDEDATALDEIVTEAVQRQRRDEERRKEVELDLTIGTDRLQITSEFIQYRDVRMKTDDVCSLRWGIYKHYINGVRVQRNFTIWVEASSCGITMEIECVRFFDPERKVLERYGTIIEKLWSAAGVRILIGLANRLMAGETVRVGDANVTKNGVWLGKRNWFKSEPYFGGWEELTKSTDSGQLIIGSTRERKASVSIPLRDVDNAVVLERLLGFLWKDGHYARLQAGTLFQE